MHPLRSYHVNNFGFIYGKYYIKGLEFSQSEQEEEEVSALFQIHS